MGADDLGQLFQRVGGKIIAVGVRDVVHLRRNSRVHLVVRMAKAIDGRPARSVDILLASRIPQIAALCPHDAGQIGGGFQRFGGFGGHLLLLCRATFAGNPKIGKSLARSPDAA